jgi:hypothetical protein
LQVELIVGKCIVSWFGWLGRVNHVHGLRGGLEVVLRCTLPWQLAERRHEVLFCVPAEVAARFEMMDLEILRTPPGLAPPPITPQDLLA